MTSEAGLHITDGTAQNTRFPAALEEGYFKVDEMTFEDLLTLSVELASYLHFYNLQYKREGSWAELFEGDDAVVMAQILSLDLKRLETDFQRRFESSLEDVAEGLCEFVKDIDGWLQKLKTSSHKSGKALGAKIEEVIEEKLADEFRSLREYLNLLVQGQSQPKPAFALEGLDHVWEKTKKGQAISQSKRPDSRSVIVERRQFRSIFYAFFHAVLYLQSIAAAYLQKTLSGQAHDPSVGLLMVFLKLFGKAQERINTFSQRHLDFYYQTLLKACPRESMPDSADLVLETEAGVREVFIPKGTEFLAGKDLTGKDLVYIADDNLGVTDARVHTLSTLFFERNRLISPEAELQYITRARTHRLPVDLSSSETVDSPSWPLFGAERTDVESGTAKDAEFGFAVASSVLRLKEGLRTIEVTLRIADPADVDPTVALAWREFNRQGWKEKKENEKREFVRQVFVHYLTTHQELLTEDDHLDTVDVAEGLIHNLSLEAINQALQDQQQSSLFNLFLVELVKGVGSAESFQRVLGKIMSRFVLTPDRWLTPDIKKVILEKAEGVVTTVSYQQISELLKKDRQTLFYTLLQKIMTIHLTAENGWHGVSQYTLAPTGEEETVEENGLKFVVTLGPEIDPIIPYASDIHGGQWETQLPLILFRLNPQSHFYAYSLFSGLTFRSVVIETHVQGVKTLLIYNQQGQLDPSKPFNPFGPLPTCNSYCIIGNYEVATKNITSLAVEIEWGDIPQGLGGFREYYQGYEPACTNEDFQAELSLFQDGHWQPSRGEAPNTTVLFDTESGEEKLKESQSIAIDLLRYFKPLHWTISEDEFGFDLQARDGFYKIALVGPSWAFGHANYPTLLAKALSENVKRKRFQPIPNPPYTPLVNRIALNYRARSVIEPGIKGVDDPVIFHEKIIPLHPFGPENNYPADQERPPAIVPRYPYDGNLFIGIAARQLQGVLTLFFHICPDSTQAVISTHSDIAWFYLASNCWCRLEPSRVLSDTTDGFLTSGIVTLDLPNIINRDNSIMPRDLFWLSVSANKNLNTYCSLYSVRPHALRVRWVDRENLRSPMKRNSPAGSIQQTRTSIPGLGSITQMNDAFGGTLPEDTRQMKMRMSERLRHKHRASTPWDYERLILEYFPEIFKVKCFSGMTTSKPGPQPGHVLIVVVPHVGEKIQDHNYTPMVDTTVLHRIRTFVQTLVSPFTNIEVRNPTYERIQIRCTIKLTRNMYRGFFVKKVNQSINAFLSPWHEGGYVERFGWRIKREDIESVIRDLDGVEFVTNFSMLHITEDNKGDFSLNDTARSKIIHSTQYDAGKRQALERSVSEEITPKYPWSLAIPMDHHFIETIDVMRFINAEVTGIDELEVGSTLIISGSESYGEEK